MSSENREKLKNLKHPESLRFHKFAAMYHWNWQEYNMTPEPVLLDLETIINILEDDLEYSLCPCETSQIKMLRRKAKAMESNK